MWIWKDEQLHAEFVRGALLRAGGLGPAAVVYGRQVQGALSGWTSATSNHRDPRTAPFRAGAAGLLVAVGAATGQVPPVLRRQLRYQTFRHYCRLNAALEASAELAYRRLAEVPAGPMEQTAFARIRDDEARHAAAFRLLAGALGEGDRLTAPLAVADLVAGLGAISTWFVPAHLRPALPNGPERQPRGFGSRQAVVVRHGRAGTDKAGVLEECLDRAGLGDIAAGAASAAVRVSFMLGYDRRDRSNVSSPEMVEILARYLRRHGVGDVAVLEAPTVYGNDYAHRSVAEVAAYFGFVSPTYRVVDISQDLEPFTYQRGFAEHAISKTWHEADVRVVMPKLRTAPTDFAHLSLCTLEGTSGRIDDTVYAGRQVDYRSATMMVLDVAPPDFSVVDGWEPVADGPFGVMGCHRPARSATCTPVPTPCPSTRWSWATSGSPTRARPRYCAWPTTGSAWPRRRCPWTANAPTFTACCAAPTPPGGGGPSGYCPGPCTSISVREGGSSCPLSTRRPSPPVGPSAPALGPYSGPPNAPSACGRPTRSRTPTEPLQDR